MRRRKLGATTAGVAAAALLLVAGCSLITSYAEFDKTTPSVCGTAVPPPPVNAPSGGQSEVLGVTADVTFLDAFDGGGVLGYNIDELCTCPGKPACTPPATAGPDDNCDKPSGSGIDDEANDIAKYLFATRAAGAVNPILDGLRAGQWGFMVDVQNWNGRDDDDAVTVGVFNTAGIRNDAGPATYKGTDVFIVDGKSVANDTGNGASRYVSTNAYVTHGVLVAPFTELDINVLLSDLVSGVYGTRLQIPFHGASLIGKFSSNGNGGLIMPKGQLVGRVSSTDMLKQVKRLGACTTATDASIPVAAAKTLLCSKLDITVKPVAGGTTAPCDAISFSIGFDIEPALKATDVHPDLELTPGPCPNDPDLSCP